jgi:putative glutamine amidotransferase
MAPKPLIAITVSLDRGQRIRPGRDYLYVARAYSERVAEAGGVPVLVGPDAAPPDVAWRCDGLVITGGEDLPERLPPFDSAPANGGHGAADATRGFELGALGVAEDPERIGWDRAVLDAVYRAGKPVFGVCYGMQLLNVHFGGSLYLDVTAPALSANPVAHGGSGVVTTHALIAEAPSALWATAPLPREVNSSHRQGVSEVAPGFVVTSRSADGLVESIERGSLFGLQWHPETDLGSRAAWRSWVTLCGS